ncbi:MAG: CAP domain-containing protein [Oscillospiraceae bacterium]
MRRNKFFSKTAGLMTAVVMTVAMFTGGAFFQTPSVSAASAATITIAGTDVYSEAFAVLTKVNKERAAAGVSALSMDKELLAFAMQRASEIAVDFSHTRPDGSDCLDFSGDYRGENIAAGQSSAAAVMTSWMNSSGHRANILETSFKSIGIGCVKVDGMLYWTQSFSSDKATAVTKPADGAHSRKVAVISATLLITPSPVSVSVAAGKTASVSFAGTNLGWDYVGFSMKNSDFAFTSSNKSIFTVSAAGVVTGVSAGKATLKAVCAGVTKSIPVTVTGKKSVASLTAALSRGTYTYTGVACKPTVKISGLTAGTDFTVSYKNNTAVGKATATVTGKGNYTGTKTLTFKIVPKSVTGVTKSSVTATSFKLAWNKGTNCTGYAIYRYNTATAKWVLAKRVTSASATSAMITGLTKATVYRYKINAYKTVNGVNYYAAGVVVPVTTKS